MLLKDWANTGSNEFYTNKLRILATNELPAEKWSSEGRNNFNILNSYIRFTFEKLYQESENANSDDTKYLIYEDDKQACFNTGLYDKTWQPIYFYCVPNRYDCYQKWEF
ncbi:MAG: DUF3825 domain-containing protein, partial [Hydrogenoanaerobacterium sp.]